MYFRNKNNDLTLASKSGIVSVKLLKIILAICPSVANTVPLKARSPHEDDRALVYQVVLYSYSSASKRRKAPHI